MSSRLEKAPVLVVEVREEGAESGGGGGGYYTDPTAFGRHGRRVGGLSSCDRRHAAVIVSRLGR